MKVNCNNENIRGCKTILDVLGKLGINRETVIVAKNGTIVPESEKISKKDELEIIRVVSSG